MLRPATDNDLALILGWRNHPKVRGVSMVTAVIAPAEHARWWARVSADPTRHVLIFEYDGRPAGVVNVSVEPDSTAEWGFFLDVAGLEASGQLLAAWMELEKAAIAYGFGELGLPAMGGRTLAWNAQVLALHRRFGFVEVPSRRYVCQIDGADHEVVWTELTAERFHARAARR